MAARRPPHLHRPPHLLLLLRRRRPSRAPRPSAPGFATCPSGPPGCAQPGPRQPPAGWRSSCPCRTAKAGRWAAAGQVAAEGWGAVDAAGWGAVGAAGPRRGSRPGWPAPGAAGLMPGPAPVQAPGQAPGQAPVQAPVQAHPLHQRDEQLRLRLAPAVLAPPGAAAGPCRCVLPRAARLLLRAASPGGRRRWGRRGREVVGKAAGPACSGPARSWGGRWRRGRGCCGGRWARHGW
jgi:hypothetical protein